MKGSFIVKNSVVSIAPIMWQSCRWACMAMEANHLCFHVPVTASSIVPLRPGLSTNQTPGRSADVFVSSVCTGSRTSTVRTGTPTNSRSRKSTDFVRKKKQEQISVSSLHEEEAKEPTDVLNSSSSSHPGRDLDTALQCQHFDKCSGCSYEWNIDKPAILEEAKHFFNDRGIHELNFSSGDLWEWRCRAKLAVRGTQENPLIGLYQEGTHTVVEIPSCRAHHPNINYAVKLLKEAMRQFNVQPYDEASGEGDLRYVQMAVTTYNTSLPSNERYKKGKVQVTLVWNSRDEASASAEKLMLISQFLWKNAGRKSHEPVIHSVWANFQTSRSNTIFGRRWRHIVGDQDFWEHIGGVDICLRPASFAQANTQAFSSLIYKLGRYVNQGSSVVELYAGVGIIGLSLAVTRKCRSIKCVEISKESKIPFEISTTRLPKSLGCSVSWHCADVSESPIHWLMGSDVVVVDPPRKGLEPSVIDALQIASLRGQQASDVSSRIEKRPWILRAQQPDVHVQSKTSLEQISTWPDTLIYVSCGWETFKRDCLALLSKKAWHVHDAHAFNFFPGTDRIEVLAIFKRGERRKEKKKLKKSSRRRI